MRNFIGMLTVATCLLATQVVHAQSTTSGSDYDSHEAFAPLFYPAYGDDIRTATGTPGPKYWQNSADYKITADLDDENKALSGTVVITYRDRKSVV